MNDFIKSGASDAEIEGGLKNCFVMAEHDGIIGFAILKSDLLHLMMVSAPYQRQGYGAQLLRYAETAMFAEHERIHLQSFCDNTEALSFYQKHGWVQREPSDDDDSGITMIYLEKHRKGV